MKIKGFDKNLCCRGMRFEIGKIYDTGAKDDEIRLCSNTVYHYCDNITQVHVYYSCDPAPKNRFCEIEVLGAEVTDGEKCGSNKIKIVREIVDDELKALIGQINGNTGLFNSGNQNSGDYNSGDYNSGNYNSGDYNSGDYNSGDYNSGDYNSGNCNSGNYNSGNCNSGYWNSGNCNSGDYNSGNCNSGYWNSGNCNSGDWNSCDNSTGIFCNQEDKNIRIFNKPSGMNLREFRGSKYYKALYSQPLELTYWDEKEQKLKNRSYKKACAPWWEAMSNENKQIIMEIPNFDPDVFFDITGIDVTKEYPNFLCRAIAQHNKQAAPPVGRCGDCKNATIFENNAVLCNRFNYGMAPGDFCSYFEPKEE